MKEKIIFETHNSKIILEAVKPELDFSEETKIAAKAMDGKIVFEINAPDESSLKGAKMTIKRFFRTAQAAVNI